MYTAVGTNHNYIPHIVRIIVFLLIQAINKQFSVIQLEVLQVYLNDSDCQRFAFTKKFLIRYQCKWKTVTRVKSLFFI
jgi:hypothetical protein